MNRELNPQLFGGRERPEPVFEAEKQAKSPLGRNPGETATPTPYIPNELKGLEGQLATLRQVLAQVVKRNEVITAKMEELEHNVLEKYDDLAQAVSAVRQAQILSQKENDVRFSQFRLNFGEADADDVKIQQLIERHNTIVRDFENRMATFSRLMSEQEMTLLNVQAELAESRRKR